MLISSSEIAFFSLTQNDRKHLEEEATFLSKQVLGLLGKRNTLLATILLSSNFINIAIVVLAHAVLSSLLPENILSSGGLTIVITVICVTFLMYLFSDITPKIYANRFNIRLSKIMVTPISLLATLFYFPNQLLLSGSNWLETRLATRLGHATSKEDIDEAIDLTVSQEKGSQSEVNILKGIITFGDVSVKQIMRPRLDVVTIDIERSYHEVLEIVKSSGYSRIPVYEEDFDQVVGILYAKDLVGLLEMGDDFRWQDLVRNEILFVPEAKKLADLLKEFKVSRKHMAIVVNEYGGSVGIVTLEDVLEEIVGDIRDEFDDEPELAYKQIDERNFEFDGKTLINDFCKIINVNSSTFDDIRGDADSLAGLILQITGKFPAKHQIIPYEDYQFKITSIDRRRIEYILVTLPKNNEITN
jgi:gliding motility-associated protein GldE